MLSAIGTWFATEGAGLLLGFLSNLILTAVKDWQANKTLTDLGRVTAERNQAQAANTAKDAELDALANAPKDTDAALKRLDEGSA